MQVNKPTFPCRNLFILTVGDEVWATRSEREAITEAKRLELNADPGEQVSIWKVDTLQVERVAIQREVIRESLVLYGTQVKE